jgi:hypothetical protein
MELTLSVRDATVRGMPLAVKEAARGVDEEDDLGEHDGKKKLSRKVGMTIEE